MGANLFRWPAGILVLGALAMATGIAAAAAGGPDDPWFPGLVAATANRCEHPAAGSRRSRGPPTALDWLSAHQRPDGGFARDGDPEGPADLPASGLAILAFLAQGETPKHGDPDRGLALK
jgi:hypothetical protein